MITLVAILLSVAPLMAQQAVVARTQTLNAKVYVQIRLPSPPDMRLPRAQGQAIDKIALNDLARYPTLISLDAAARNIAWHHSTDAKTLEFLGLEPLARSAKFLLVYPTESDDKPPRSNWKEVEIAVDLSTAAKVSPKLNGRTKAVHEDDLEGRWAAAWAREFAIRERQALDSEVFRFARQELCRKYKVADPLPRPPLIATAEDPAKRIVDTKGISGLEPLEHPWKELLAGRQPTIEPLARLVPADFYYLRLKAGEGASVLNQVRHWAKIAVAAYDGTGRDDRLAERYMHELGLAHDTHGEFRLPHGTREAAIVGSDWHFRSGADVTLICAIDDAEAFKKDQRESRDQKSDPFAALDIFGGEEYGGINIESRCGGIGLQRYSASLGDFAVLSNSRVALHRVVDAFRRQVPTLADAPEFQLLRTVFRADEPADAVSLFVPESYFLNQFGPRRQIALRRRAEEASMQRQQSVAALLTAWEIGHAPLRDAERYFGPLIENDIDTITRSEDEYYQQFREIYRAEIAPLIAPFGMRFSSRAGMVGVDAFVMSSRDADFWDSLRRHFGKGGVAREANDTPGSAVRLVASFHNGEMDWARFKNTLIKLGVDRKHLTNHFEWMGDRWTLNIGDSLALAKLIENAWHVDLTATDLSVSHDKRDERWLLAQLPATLAIEIAKPLFFQGTMNKAKQIVAETFSKLITWETLPEQYRGIKITRLQPSQALLLLAFGKLLKPEESPGLFYANDGRVVVLATSLDNVRAGIEREIRPDHARPLARERANGWLAVDVASSPNLASALQTAFERQAHRQALASIAHWQWLYDCEALTGKESTAERDAVARRWLGFVPSSQDASEFHWDAHRREVVNVRHGSLRQPQLLSEPPAESPWLKFLSEFGKIRGRMEVRPDGTLGVLLIQH